MKTLLDIASELGPELSKHVDEEEKNRRLSEPVVTALKNAGFYKLFLPKSLGGLEVDPMTVVEVTEELTRHNTAAGWSIMVTNTSNWWGCRIPEKGIEEIHSHANPVMAGALHPPMMAVRSDNGYLITGRSPLASNVHEAHWIFVTALVMENNQPKMNNGRPEVIGAVMNTKDCAIIDTWYTIGMKATDSNDIAATDVFVPDHRLFKLVPEFEPNRYYQGPLYRFSAMGSSITSLIAPVALALARNSIMELKAIAQKKVPFGSTISMKEKGTLQRKLGMAEAAVQSSRAYLHHTLSKYWNKNLAGNKLSLEDKADLLLAAAHTNSSCLNAVDLVYGAAGTTGIYTKNKLSHYFSNAQVVRQHGFMNDSRYETAAQVYLGLQPDLPMLSF